MLVHSCSDIRRGFRKKKATRIKKKDRVEIEGVGKARFHTTARTATCILAFRNASTEMLFCTEPNKMLRCSMWLKWCPADPTSETLKSAVVAQVVHHSRELIPLPSQSVLDADTAFHSSSALGVWGLV